MSQWIVEGTRFHSFRIAHDLAQQQADRQQALVPLVRDCGQLGFVVVKMVSPRPKICRTKVGSEYHDGSFHSPRSAPDATASARDQAFPNCMN